MMKITLIFLIFVIGFNSNSFSQVKRTNLLGTWYANNDDSLFYKTDTITLYTINYGHISACHVVKWNIFRHNFDFQYLYACAEPGTIKSYIDKEKLKLRNNGDLHIIEYYRKGMMINRFEILTYCEERLDKFPYELKTLKIRIIE